MWVITLLCASTQRNGLAGLSDEEGWAHKDSVLSCNFGTSGLCPIGGRMNSERWKRY